ncbi:unnamed protein product [Amoebophrya sp. A120]|nr:unnamed protein product [Amoebophrya sp. A120]|eukprot:GSA120T00001482001.1
MRWNTERAPDLQRQINVHHDKEHLNASPNRIWWMLAGASPSALPWYPSVILKNHKENPSYHPSYRADRKAEWGDVYEEFDRYEDSLPLPNSAGKNCVYVDLNTGRIYTSIKQCEEVVEEADMYGHVRKQFPKLSLDCKPSAKDERAIHLQKYGTFGSKIQKICFLLRQIRTQDSNGKVIVFCQSESLLEIVANALSSLGFAFIHCEGGPAEQSAALEAFQTGNSDVLEVNTRQRTFQSTYILLLSMQKMSAGANLTAANHIIFVHPFSCATYKRLEMQMSQAIGRCRRLGQERKEVHVWRFFTTETLEEDMMLEQEQARAEYAKRKLLLSAKQEDAAMLSPRRGEVEVAPGDFAEQDTENTVAVVEVQNNGKRDDAVTLTVRRSFFDDHIKPHLRDDAQFDTFDDFVEAAKAHNCEKKQERKY